MDELTFYPGYYTLKAAGKAGARRLLGLRFPREYGGRGQDWRSEIVALEGDATSSHREE